MARPRTTIKWEGVSVRFTDAEKKKLSHISKASGFSMAEFIRRSTMEAVDKAHKSGRVEVRIR